MKARWHPTLTKATVCLVHGAFMLLISWFWLSLNFNLELEENLVKWSSVAKRSMPFARNHEYANRYLIVDIGGTLTLTDNDAGSGKQVITNRLLLDSLLTIIANASDPPRYVLCDVFLESSTPHDAHLRATIGRIPNIVFPYRYEGDSIRQPAINGIPTAYSGYYSSSGVGLKESFLKFHLIEQANMVSIPLEIYSKLNRATVKKSMGLVWFDGQPMLNTVIPDIRIIPAQLSNDAGFSQIVPLEELLSINNPTVVSALMKEKIVVIGDFQHEQHDTIYGTIPGSLILVNILEALLLGDGFLHVYTIVFLLACYSLFSYLLFYYQGGPGSLQDRLSRFIYPLIGTVGSRILAFSFGLYIVSIISYFVFGLHTDIIPMATYLSMISLLKRKWTR